MKFYGSLKAELDKAKEDLKEVEENIKKIIGRDPNEGPPNRLALKRPANTIENRNNGEEKDAVVSRADTDFVMKGRNAVSARNWQDTETRIGRIDEDRPSVKRRLGDPKAVFSRLSGPPRGRQEELISNDDTFSLNKPAVPSQVIVTPREIPSRQEVLAAQGCDESSRARNRRMFGALMGTLQKFRQEESRLKDKEDKRAQVEKKVEEAAKREKEELKRERQELFQSRKRRQAEIRNIELKMIRLQEQDAWEATHRHLLNFIQTKTKPHLFYLPKKHNTKTEERWTVSQKVITKIIGKKREEVEIEVAGILKHGQSWHGDQEEEIDAEHDSDTQEDAVDKENSVLIPDLSNVKVESTDKITRSKDCVSVVSDRDISLGDGTVKVEDSTIT